MAKKTTALAKAEKVSTLAPKMEDWEIELADKAKEQVAAEVLGTPRITHRGGILKIDGNKVEGNKLPIAILTYGLMKTYYAQGFDPDAEGQTPDCYAFASAKPGEEAKMAPHEASPDKQSEACAGCPHNVFGTAEKGQGKRCSDKRRVLCVVSVDDEESIQAAEVRQFEIPPGSLKNWGAYLRSLKEVTASGSPSAVLTQLSAEPSDTGAHKLTFKAIGRLTKEQGPALIAKAKQVENDLFLPFPKIQKEEKAPPKKNSKVRGK